MSNASIIKQIVRLQAAINERAQLWNPTFVVLQSAEETAWKQFMAASVLKKPYVGNDSREKKRAVKAAFASTTVFGSPAWLFRGTMYLGLGRGFQYFNAIDIDRHGRDESAGMTDRNDQLEGRSVYGGLSDFADLLSRFVKDLHWVNVDLQRLIKRLESERSELPADHAANALAAMLFSPILYPPEKFPDIDNLALGMEWTMWVCLIPYVAESIASDGYRERASQNAIVDIDLMIRRLWHIIRKGAPGIDVPGPMKNPDKFRQDLLEGRFNQSSARTMGSSEYRVEIPVRFPEALVKFLNANAEQRRLMVRNARAYLRPNDAKIAA